MSREQDEEARRRMHRAVKYRAARQAEQEHRNNAETEGPPPGSVGDVAARADAALQQEQPSGEFENHAYARKPIPGLGQNLDPDWWVKSFIEREQLTGLAPAPFLLRKDDAELDELLDKQFSEARVREILEEFNARIIEARRQLLGGPPVVTRLRDLEREVTRWRERRAARNPAPDQSVPERPRSRWWRRRR